MSTATLTGTPVQRMICRGHTKVSFVHSNSYPATIAELECGINLSFWLTADFDLRHTDEGWTVGGFRYITDPQSESIADRALRSGSIGWLVVRYGPQATVDWELFQKVNCLPVTLGTRTIEVTHADEFGKFCYAQDVNVTGDLIIAEIER